MFAEEASTVIIWLNTHVSSAALPHPACAKAEDAVAMPCSVALCSWVEADWNACVATGHGPGSQDHI